MSDGWPSIMNQSGSDAKGSIRWGTPWWFIRALEEELGGFQLDPCCDGRDNARAPEFYTPETDGLLQPWFGRVFVNPPYARRIVKLWIRKALAEMAGGDVESIALLIPYRTGTLWFDELWGRADEVRRIVGRLHYEHPTDKTKWGAGTFDSALVVLRRRCAGVEYLAPRNTRWDIREQQKAAEAALRG